MTKLGTFFRSNLKLLVSIFVVGIVVLSAFVVSTQPALAQDGTEVLEASPSVFGDIAAPTGVEAFETDGAEIGLLNFISRLVQVFTVICGIITFFNFLFSGYTYIMSDGSSKAAETVRNRLTYSILGLILIVSAYTIIALISLILFGNATYILNPTITAPGELPPAP